MAVIYKLEVITILNINSIIELKITSKILYILAICLALIFIAKIFYWLKTDEPIRRGSMLILALFIVFLTVRNKYTYFLLGGLALFCIIYRFTNQHWSGSLIVDFMSSFRRPMSSVNKMFLIIPSIVYYLILLLMVFSSTRKLYFKSNGRK